MTDNKLTDERITELYGELFDELEVHQRATGDEGYFAVQCGEVMSALKELQEYRRADTFRENSNSSTETIRENAETSTKCRCSSCLAASILSGEKSINDQ